MISRSRETAIVAESGFTLLEIMVVLVIAGLLMGLALERGPLRSNSAAFSAARASALTVFHDAQTLAQASGDVVTVQADAATGHLMTRRDRSSHDQHIGAGVRLLLPLPDGRFAPRALYRFTADGSASGPPVLLTLGRQVCVISFSLVTGRISASESQNP
ncbi:prepilin-type N-terminal cleavage/methylation domain-containing protein [Acetobacter musti]|uniref:Prepilin-type N-terminal cleavage/methylation domain-containing protein n=1 Tax=Acetobacter musti TaxID=864732 RepID=A0ABX0JWN4_9PROT|nr:prepilin-type N-terminal cleavage/methylation domain-containing protein [Acetobacter musti]NHN86418.1 prepilin-type N-terminal cleavage/methylation domain-containing protein [Acetobacter musti]